MGPGEQLQWETEIMYRKIKYYLKKRWGEENCFNTEEFVLVNEESFKTEAGYKHNILII